MSDTKFQASVQRGSEVVLKKKVFDKFLFISMFQTRTPCSGAIWDPGTTTRTNIVKDY